MSLCQIELMNAGKPYPRTCQTCGLGGACVKGLVRGAPDRNPTSLPEFDAHGWCHDMSAAPRDGTPLLLHSARALEQGRMVKRGGCAVDFWHDPKRDDCGFTGWGKFNTQYWPPTAWRPLPLPPVKE